MPAKAVVFDLDGTLLNSLDDLADSCNAALVGLGYPPHPVPDYAAFLGDGMETLVSRALPESAQHDIPRAVTAMRREYAGRWGVKSAPYPGIPELLDTLADKGLALGVLSNKPDDFAKLITDHIFARWPFTACVGVTPQTPCKPDPAGAVRAARLLGQNPADCLLVGDSPMDVHAALGAGMTPVAVTWGFRPESVLRASGATRLAYAPRDVLNYL
ncbi:HAD family hydrolase [Fundidesulfovibrio butyratiphilus]